MTDVQTHVAPYLDQFGPWRWSRAEVNRPMIWNYCEAVEDANPVYWDEETAEASRFGRLIAPPQMIMTMSGGHWWAPDIVRERESAERAAQGEDPTAEIARIVEEAGFATATMVTREDEYLSPYGPGDGRIRQASKVLDVTEPKQTKVGRGVFITSVIEYRAESDDRPVVRSKNVLLRYDPSTPRDE